MAPVERRLVFRPVSRPFQSECLLFSAPVWPIKGDFSPRTAHNKAQYNYKYYGCMCRRRRRRRLAAGCEVTLHSLSRMASVTRRICGSFQRPAATPDRNKQRFNTDIRLHAAECTMQPVTRRPGRRHRRKRTRRRRPGLCRRTGKDPWTDRGRAVDGPWTPWTGRGRVV